MLPHSTGQFALPSSRLRSRRLRGTVVVGTLGALILSTVALGSSPIAAGNDSGWVSTSWTGVRAGAPEPGVGLPAAATPPGAPVALPPEMDIAPEYEGQSQCDPTPKPGTQKLADFIKSVYGQQETVWIPRGCDVGGQSEHKEGRAVDWMVDVRDAQDRANAESFLNWLLGPDQFGVEYGNAIRLGIMYIGWNDRIWRGYDIARGWTELKGCFGKPDKGSDNYCHRNHIHISQTWDGATGRTSFWDGTPMNSPFCPRDKSSAGAAPATRTAGVVGIGQFRVLGTRSGKGLKQPCRLQQDRWKGDSRRLFAKVTGQGGVPETGVAAVLVRVSALGNNAPTTIRAWSPGASSSVPVVKAPMNSDSSGDAIVPVAQNGTIAIATIAGATDITVDVLGYYPDGGEVENKAEVVSDTLVAPLTEFAPAAPAPAPEPAPAPAAPAEPAPNPEGDRFVGVGSELAYESATQGAIQPGEVRTVTLSGLPAEATAALVTLTTSESTTKGKLRIGQIGEKSNAAKVKVRKNATRTSILVVPVSAGTVQIAASKKPTLQVKVEILGYQVGADPLKARGMSAARLIKTKLDATQVKVVKTTGIGSVPKKKKKVAGVILRITTKGKGTEGRVAAYAVGGVDRGTRSAYVGADGKNVSIVVAEVGDKGLIALASSVPTKATVQVIGYIRR
ncbi:MAG: hypothetical protein K9G69_07365 [Candidatus Nanopelagicales bacterium]|nr:hypothetical protein [Candidatus Nanopelagicales bacterium]